MDRIAERSGAILLAALALVCHACALPPVHPAILSSVDTLPVTADTAAAVVAFSPNVTTLIKSAPTGLDKR